MSTLKGYVIRNDIRLYLLFNREIQNRILDQLMLLLTKLFDTPMVCVFAGAAMIYSALSDHALGIDLVFILAISELITHSIKRVVSRVRPFVALSEALFEFVPPKDIYSFPSGHTCAAFSYALAFSMFFPGLKFVFIGLASLVGLSRIYLGYHYPTDVVIGAFIPLFVKVGLLYFGVI